MTSVTNDYFRGVGSCTENAANLRNILNRVEHINRVVTSAKEENEDLTLNKTTADGAPPITINTVSDTTQLMEPVKKFVEDYNTLIESLNKAVKETVYRDFPPLSDTQKEEMSEEQIKKWEEKARSGMLRGDSLVRGLASKLQDWSILSVARSTTKYLTPLDRNSQFLLLLNQSCLILLFAI